MSGCVGIGGAVEVFVNKMGGVVFVETAGRVEVSAEIGGMVGVFTETRGVAEVYVAEGSRGGVVGNRGSSSCCSSRQSLASGLTSGAP